MFYTYIWKDANGTPFYVGKGKGKRYLAANAQQRSKDFMLVYAGGGCVSEIVDEFIHESEAFAHEMELIQRYGRRDFGGTLVNLTDGGEGASGWVPSEETKLKIGLGNSGKTFTPEHIEKLRKARLGKKDSDQTKYKKRIAMIGNTHTLGLKMTKESRERNSAAQKGKKMSAEAVKKSSGSRTGQKRTIEQKAKMSLAKIGKKQTKEHIEKSRLARIGKKLSDDVINRIKSSLSLIGPKRGLYKGVSCRKKTNYYCAIITNNREKKHLGTFPTPEQAARAYDKAAIAAWGIGNCYLNFPNEVANYVDIAA